MYKSIQKEMTNDDRIKSQKKRYPSIFKDCITYLFSSYITIFSKNVGVTNTISTLFEYDPSSSTEAFYDPKTTSITLNLARIEIASIVTFIIHMYDAIQKDISFLKNNETYKTYFRPKPGGKALTIIHELEHARRNSSHTDSASHGFSTDADGNPGKIFDICANSFGFKAIQEKLLEKWKEAMFNFIDNDKNTIEILRFNNISYDEKEDKEVLLKALELI
jgi:hypothetical protein